MTGRVVPGGVAASFLLAPLLLALSLVFVLLGAIGPAYATPQYAQQTGRDCSSCHTSPGGPLTSEGQAFVQNGYALPTTGGGTTGTTGGGGDVLLTLPSWLRSLLLWFHLVGMVTWLGAIVFVHIVQTPRIAGKGIPSGYFKLAWPAIIALGFSGLLLTLNDISGAAVLIDTHWGRILLVKIALYVLLVAVAAFVTFFLSPRLKRLAEQSSTGVQDVPFDRFKQEGRVVFGYGGQLYDVTPSRLWREGRHAKRHEAWQDLTQAMAGAPHGLEVLERAQPVEGAGAPAEAGEPRPVRFFIVLAYANLALVLLALLVVALW